MTLPWDPTLAQETCVMENTYKLYSVSRLDVFKFFNFQKCHVLQSLLIFFINPHLHLGMINKLCTNMSRKLLFQLFLSIIMCSCRKHPHLLCKGFQLNPPPSSSLAIPNHPEIPSIFVISFRNLTLQTPISLIISGDFGMRVEILWNCT